MRQTLHLWMPSRCQAADHCWADCYYVAAHMHDNCLEFML